MWGKLNLLLLGQGIWLEMNIPVYETKLLDIIVDQHLTWSKHIENIASKMGGGVSMDLLTQEYYCNINSQSVVMVILQDMLLMQGLFCLRLKSTC